MDFFRFICGIILAEAVICAMTFLSMQNRNFQSVWKCTKTRTLTCSKRFYILCVCYECHIQNIKNAKNHKKIYQMFISALKPCLKVRCVGSWWYLLGKVQIAIPHFALLLFRGSEQPWWPAGIWDMRISSRTRSRISIEDFLNKINILNKCKDVFKKLFLQESLVCPLWAGVGIRELKWN